MARAVLFDLFNTLVASGDPDRAAVVGTMGAELGVDPDDFVRAFHRTWRERMVGALGDLATQCRELAARLGGQPTDEQIARAVELRLAFDRRTIVLADETLVALKALRANGFRVAIVSNCTVDSGTVLRSTPLVDAIDAMVLSYEVGVAKPDPRIYTTACDRIGVPAAACVYVGDGSDDELYGAESLGMRVLQTTQFADSDRSWAGEKIATVTDVGRLIGRPD